MAGERAHRVRGEKPCDPCREAAAEYMREYRRRRKARTVKVDVTIGLDAQQIAERVVSALRATP